MSPEEWRAVPGQPHYEASTRGRVRSIDRHVEQRGKSPRWWPGKVLKGTPNRTGHIRISLAGQEQFAVHQVVLLTFVGPCPPGMQCCHNDGDPANNHLSNLRYGTPADNSADRIAHGRSRQGVLCNLTKLGETAALEIFRRSKAGEKASTLAEAFGTSTSNVYNIRSGVSWGWLTSPEAQPPGTSAP